MLPTVPCTSRSRLFRTLWDTRRRHVHGGPGRLFLLSFGTYDGAKYVVVQAVLAVCSGRTMAVLLFTSWTHDGTVWLVLRESSHAFQRPTLCSRRCDSHRILSSVLFCAVGASTVIACFPASYSVQSALNSHRMLSVSHPESRCCGRHRMFTVSHSVKWAMRQSLQAFQCLALWTHCCDSHHVLSSVLLCKGQFGRSCPTGNSLYSQYGRKYFPT